MSFCMRFSSKLLSNFYLPGFITTRSYFSHGQNSEIEISSIHVCGIRMLPDWWVQLIRYSNFCLKNKICLYVTFPRSSKESMQIKYKLPILFYTISILVSVEEEVHNTILIHIMLQKKNPDPFLSKVSLQMLLRTVLIKKWNFPISPEND